MRRSDFISLMNADDIPEWLLHFIKQIKQDKESLMNIRAYPCDFAPLYPWWALAYGLRMHYPYRSIPGDQAFVYFEDLFKASVEEVRERLQGCEIEGDMPHPHLTYMEVCSMNPDLVLLYQRWIRHWNTAAMYPLSYPPNDYGVIPRITSVMNCSELTDDQLRELCCHYGLMPLTREHMLTQLEMVLKVNRYDLLCKDRMWAEFIVNAIMLRTPESFSDTIPKQVAVAMHAVTTAYKAFKQPQAALSVLSQSIVLPAVLQFFR